MERYILFYDPDQKEVAKAESYLSNQDFTTLEVSYNEGEQVYELSVLEEEFELAKNSLITYLNQELQQEKDIHDEISAGSLTEDLINAPSSAYVNKNERYEDVSSSGYALLVIGIIGLAFILLEATGITSILHFNLNTAMRYIYYITMGLLFAVFIFFGIRSLQSAVVIKKRAKEEDALIAEIEEWAQCIKVEDVAVTATEAFVAKETSDDATEENETSADVENTTDDDKESETVADVENTVNDNEEYPSENDIYFEQLANIEKKLVAQYPDLEDSLKDELCERIYTRLFDSEN
jgi:hypothetical protein